MSSETTKRQIEQCNKWLSIAIGESDAGWFWKISQAKLALVQALEIQERMEGEGESASPRVCNVTVCSDCNGKGWIMFENATCVRCGGDGIVPDGSAGGGE